MNAIESVFAGSTPLGSVCVYVCVYVRVCKVAHLYMPSPVVGELCREERGNNVAKNEENIAILRDRVLSSQIYFVQHSTPYTCFLYRIF